MICGIAVLNFFNAAFPIKNFLLVYVEEYNERVVEFRELFRNQLEVRLVLNERVGHTEDLLIIYDDLGPSFQKLRF